MRPTTSPDGKLLAFWYRDQVPNSLWQIALFSLDTQSVVKYFDVPQSPANGQSALQITPDGTAILFIDQGNSITNLLSQPLDGSPTKQLSSFAKEQFYSFNQSKDGRVVLSRGLRTTDAVLLTESR